MYRLMQGFRTATRHVIGTAIAFSLIQLGCESTAPETGTLRVRIVASGFDLDQNGYAIRLNDGDALALPAGEVERIVPGIPVGQHQLTLEEIRDNCWVAAGAETTVDVTANDTTLVEFNVSCAQRTGRLRIITQTNGVEMDANGYTVRVDEQAAVGTAPWDTIVIEGLHEGWHRVNLGGAEVNCPTAEPDRQVFVRYDSLSTTTFAMYCVPRRGRVRVTATTNGTEQDTDGYTATVQSISRSLASNGSVVIDGVTEGTHVVDLTNVAWNCRVFPERDTVVVTHGQTVDASFAVTCMPGYGTIRAITRTTGVDIDPNGYQVWVSYYVGGPIGVNDTLEFLTSSVPTDVYLGDVADNCVPDQAVRTVDVIGGTINEVVFTIVCHEWGGIRVSATTSGVDQDFNGYRAQITGPSVNTTIAVPVNGTTVIRTRAGAVSVTLEGISVNCAVTSAPTVNVTIAEGDTTNVAFGVNCAAASRLVFVRSDNGLQQIYAVNSNGGGLTRLSNRSGHDASPAWSPERTRVAFEGNRADGNHIFVMNADGSSPVQLTASIAGASANNHSPRWSPDGSKILFTSSRDGNSEIYVMNANGTNLVNLTAHAGHDHSPDWSPDGTRIVFVSNRTGTSQIHVMNADGTQPTLVGSGITSYGEVRWSPDGTRLAFAREITCGYYYSCEYGIAVVNVDGSQLRTLTSGSYDVGPSWSPDGLSLAYSAGGPCDYWGCPSGLRIDAVRVADGFKSEILSEPGYMPAWWR